MTKWTNYPVSVHEAQQRLGFAPATLPNRAEIGAYVIAENCVVVLYEGPGAAQMTELTTKKDRKTGVISTSTAVRARPGGGR
ncbi:MAG TPA: hypothetical protein VGR46_13000 [Candidatus Limnocylindria bacterium]|jgi:hypothetical protein|nr:hypothetical protein [Candidatus Limnocylindria bacterium]